ncbi:MAG: hypothetical protein QOK07_549 [Gemmatimonadaceae bacterium]|nr:hypothetical protein [Gemmatimonadaceae bacterium]
MHNQVTVRLWSTAVVAAGALTLGGCRDNPLDVSNANNPNVAQVYGTPKDVETIISTNFQQLWNAQQGNVGLGVQTQVMSFESHSGLANFGMGARAAIPRSPVSNDLGNSDQSIIFNDFDKLTRNSRSAANAIAALDRFIAAGGGTGSAAQDARAKSFAYFNLAYGLGNTALLYDSAAIITPAVPSDVIPPLSTSKAVMDVALSFFDSALVIAQSPAATNGANGWPIPKAWMSQSADISIATWQQIIHSYKARFRANNARTPAERAAVDWNAVVADATAGLTSDLNVIASASGGWGSAWIQQLAVDATWSQMTPFVLGMADTAGAYDAWLATPLNSRAPFLLRTPDLRFPSGETRATQQAVTGISHAGTAAGSVLYFRNRPVGDDKPAAPWGTWYYDNWRFWAVQQAGGNGPLLAFSRVENDLLAAEGYIRTARVALAIPLINRTRVRAGLPPIPAGATATDPVPGGNACVPRVPQPPNYTSTACGSVFEALKWEKRLETSFTGYAQWFLDARGWGDLAEGTVLEWPVPWQELYARQNLTIYTTSNSRAAKGTYGF